MCIDGHGKSSCTVVFTQLAIRDFWMRQSVIHTSSHDLIVTDYVHESHDADNDENDGVVLLEVLQAQNLKNPPQNIDKT